MECHQVIRFVGDIYSQMYIKNKQKDMYHKELMFSKIDWRKKNTTQEMYSAYLIKLGFIFSVNKF